MTDFSIPDQQTPADQPAVDPARLQNFAAGASDHSLETMPWDSLDPKDKPTINVSIRMNAYEIAILRHLVEQADTSQSKLLRRIVIPAMADRLEPGTM